MSEPATSPRSSGFSRPADSVERRAVAAGTSTDVAERRELYGKALSRISGELYWLPMFTYAKYYVYSNDLDFKTTSDEIPRFYAAKWK